MRLPWGCAGFGLQHCDALSARGAEPVSSVLMHLLHILSCQSPQQPCWASTEPWSCFSRPSLLTLASVHGLSGKSPCSASVWGRRLRFKVVVASPFVGVGCRLASWLWPSLGVVTVLAWGEGVSTGLGCGRAEHGAQNMHAPTTRIGFCGLQPLGTLCYPEKIYPGRGLSGTNRVAKELASPSSAAGWVVMVAGWSLSGASLLCPPLPAGVEQIVATKRGLRGEALKRLSPLRPIIYGSDSARTLKEY